jgi:hypothetical protein
VTRRSGGHAEEVHIHGPKGGRACTDEIMGRTIDGVNGFERAFLTPARPVSDGRSAPRLGPCSAVAQSRLRSVENLCFQASTLEGVDLLNTGGARDVHFREQAPDHVDSDEEQPVAAQ